MIDEQLNELFAVIDQDQNGLITIVELHAVVTHTVVRWMHLTSNCFSLPCL